MRSSLASLVFAGALALFFCVPSIAAMQDAPAAGGGELTPELQRELERARRARPAPAPDGGVGGPFVAGVIVVMLLVFGWRSIRERGRTGALGRVTKLAEIRPLAQVSVTTVWIAMDWRARPRVQGTLGRVLGKPSGPARDDHAAHLAAAIAEVQSIEPLWLAVGAKTEPALNAIDLAAKFDERLAHLHELYAYESIEVDGQEARTAAALRGDDRELGASVLAFLVVRTEAPSHAKAADSDGAKALLAELAAGSASLVAWDLGWGPRDLSERLSMAQLTKRFPQLSPIAEPRAELPAETAALVARWS